MEDCSVTENLVLSKIQTRLEEYAPRHQKQIMQKLQEFLSTDKVDVKRAISEELFDLEKQYIGKFQDNQIQCTNLIQTVGLREAPVILTILISKPQKCFLLHTLGSEPHAENVVQDPILKKRKINFQKILIDEVDAGNIYREVKNHVIPFLCAGTTISDPTGGRKAMVAALSSISFYYGLPMMYLWGYEDKGIILPFSEQLKSIENPYEIYGDLDLILFERLFNNHAYASARQIAIELRKKVIDPKQSYLITLLEELSDVYLKWDQFKHSIPHENLTLSEELITIQTKINSQDYQLLFDTQQITNNIEFLQGIETHWRLGEQNMIDEYRLIDFLANAERRAVLKRYDDAVARLYRSLEAASTLLLNQNGLNLKNGDFEKLLANTNKSSLTELQQAFENRFKIPLSKQIGLQQQMWLIKWTMDHPFVESYKKLLKKSPVDGKILMAIRNHSILAHGTSPVSEENYLVLQREIFLQVEYLLKQKRFNKLRIKARHPQVFLSPSKK